MACYSGARWKDDQAGIDARVVELDPVQRVAVGVVHLGTGGGELEHEAEA